MRTSLESLLDSSLNGLRELSSQVADNIDHLGPVEGLDVVKGEVIQAEVLEHIKEERYNSTDTCQETCAELLEKNEEDHAKIRRDLADLSEVVTSMTVGLEAMKSIVSMESITDADLGVANAALSNIQTYEDILPPVLVAEGGELTQASMEGMGQYIKDLYTKFKKLLKSLMANMAASYRRGMVGYATFDKRIEAVVKRLNSLGNDYGIPQKGLRYDPRLITGMVFDGKAIALEPTAIKAAGARVKAVTEFGNNKVCDDSINRSNDIADKLSASMVARDPVKIEQSFKEMFKAAIHPLPAREYSKDLGQLAGLTFLDSKLHWRTNYRDVPWIMDLYECAESPAVMYNRLKSAIVESRYLGADELGAIVQEVGDLLGDHNLRDYAFYDALSIAYMDIDKAANTAINVFLSIDSNELSNEIWRAINVAYEAMFSFITKAYYSICMLKEPQAMLIHSLLYVLEEQVKGIEKVNR